jgi:hypothetical protein
MVRKTEFICMNCWREFTPDTTGVDRVICPHCHCEQDLSSEPIEMAPEEFIELGPEALQQPPPIPDAQDFERAIAQAVPLEDPPPVTEGGNGSDEDFDGVIEIDLGEIHGAAVDQTPQEPPEAEDAGPTDAPPDQEAPPEPPSEPPASYWYLRTQSENVYAFLSPDSLVAWARGLRQDQAGFAISLDGADWKPYTAFFEKFSELDTRPPPLPEVELPPEVRSKLSDEVLEELLVQERSVFTPGEAAPAGKPAAKEAAGASTATAPVQPVAPTPTPQGARTTTDFTFKVAAQDEVDVGRYVFLVVLGLLLGGATVFSLFYLGILAP